ncbi:uncharacterized protein LOC141914044 [Tubulanus polymorphus]|uniref:uncharacterized protein LOC141914044 n=1 Tax=Tubulanus polymorphus TaxID=672921 RepID=UPI003DA50B89
MDAKPRELYLLFRAYKGYEGSLLKVTGKNGKSTSPVGFVTFSSRVAAESAKQDLQGVRFDPDLPQTLRLEFAKSNTKVTKPKQQSPQPAATHPTLIPHPLAGQDLGAAFFPGTPEAWAHHPALAAYADLSPATLHHPALIQHPALTQVHTPLAMAHHPGAVVAPTSHHASAIPNPHPQLAASPMLGSPVMSTSTSPLTAPCSTLFVANIGPNCTEAELKEVFSRYPGFSRIRMHTKGGAPVAFVEFADIAYASEAMKALNGVVLPTCERGGIRIEYAKNKMGEPCRVKEDVSLMSQSLLQPAF